MISDTPFSVSQVFEGMDVVDNIASVKKDASDKPLEDIKITGITIETV